MVDLDKELDNKLDDLLKKYNIENNAPPYEFHIQYSRTVALYQCKKRMQAEGITDESLIFNIGEIIGSEVYGTVNASPTYSHDKITAFYIEISNGKRGFKVSADGDKIKIELIK